MSPEQVAGFCMLAGIMTACSPLLVVEIVRQRRIAAEIRRITGGLVR